MTKRNGRVLIVEQEKPQQCDACGEIAELRPYGPGGSIVCFPCAMTDEDTMKAQFQKRLDGAAQLIVHGPNGRTWSAYAVPEEDAK